MTGELSGETHAFHLLQSVDKEVRISWTGIGSTKLREAGVEIVHDYHDISVTGLTEVFLKLPRIRGAYKQLKQHILSIRPALLILVDFPGFNMRFARFARKQGIPVVYFIPPQVWAWRKARIDEIKKSVDLVICILPFEIPLYEAHGIKAIYVGHPYSSIVKPGRKKEDFARQAGISGTGPVLTIMPGSRENEINRHLPVLLDIVHRLKTVYPQITVLLPVAENIPLETVEHFLQGETNIHTLKGLTYDALAASDLAIIASGSATLEAALLGVPTIVIYRISRISFLFAKLLVHVKYISLPNIIAEKEVFPEFVQQVSPEDVADRATYMLNKGKEEIRHDIAAIRTKLGDFDSYSLAAHAIVHFLEDLYGTLPKTS